MFPIDKLAEQKIAEAIKRGELNDLPGMGKPLNLDDDAMVPEELRAGFRLLKNAGYLPPDMQLRKELESVEALIAQACSQEERHKLSKRKQYLLRQINASSTDTPLLSERFYRNKFSEKP